MPEINGTPELPPRSPFEVRRRWGVTALAVCGFAAVALALGQYASSPSRPGLQFASENPGNFVFGGPSGSQEKPAPKSLLPPPAPYPTPLEESAQNNSAVTDEPLSVDELMGMLDQRVPRPEAARVAQDMAKDPGVQAAWKVYQKKGGSESAEREFVDYVKHIPQFRQLAARFKSEPGGRQASFELARRSPDGAAAPGGLKGYSGAQRGSGSGSLDPNMIAREWERKAATGLDLSAARRSGGGAPTHEGAREMIAAANISHAGGAGSAAAGGGGPGQAALADLKPGQPVHDVAPKLEKGWIGKPVGKEVVNKNENWDPQDWLKKMLQHMGPTAATDIGNRMQGRNGATQEYDIWGACWESGYYEDCVRTCNTVPEAKCSDPSVLDDPYKACRAGDVRFSQTCIVKCLDPNPHQYGCQEDNIRKGEWDQACLNQSVLQSYCLGNQRWGPPSCTGTGATRVCVDVMGTRGGAPATTAIPTTTAPTTSTAPTTTATLPTPTPTPPPKQGTYTIQSGDTLTKIVMNKYGIKDVNVAYKMALLLYDTAGNSQVSGKKRVGDPNFILPNKTLVLAGIPDPTDCTIIRYPHVEE